MPIWGSINRNGDPEFLIGNIHCRSASDDNFPVVAGIHFHEADCNHRDSQNSAE